MKRQYSLSFLLSIFVIAVFFRFWHLSSTPPGLYPDEAMNGTNGIEAAQTGDYKLFYPDNNGREGLFINIQSFSVQIFGHHPWALRLVSAIFGTLTVIGVYFLTKELFYQEEDKKTGNIFKFKTLNPEWIALFSTFFIATLFWHINFSRVGFRAISMPFYLTWSSYFLFRMIREIRTKKNLMPEVSAVLAGVFFGLGFHSYIAYRVAPLILVVPFLKGLQEYRSSKSKSSSKCFPCLFVLFLFVTFVVALPIGYYFLTHPADFTGRTSEVSVFNSTNVAASLGLNILKTLGMFFWAGDYNWRHNFSGSSELWWPLSIFFGIGIIISIVYLVELALERARTEKSRFKSFGALRSPVATLWFMAVSKLTTAEGYLFIWFAVFSIPVVISNEGLPHALRSIGLIVPAVIWAGLGITWIIEHTKQWLELAKKNYPEKIEQLDRIRIELGIFLAVFVIAVIAHSYNTYFLAWAGNPNVPDAFAEHYVILGEYLNSLPPDNNKFVIVNKDAVLVRGIPVPAQTVMFITGEGPAYYNTPTPKHITYLLPKDIPELRTLREELGNKPMYITMLENDAVLRNEVRGVLPGVVFQPEMNELIVGIVNK